MNKAYSQHMLQGTMFVYGPEYRDAETYAQRVYQSSLLDAALKDEFGIFVERVVALIDEHWEDNLSKKVYNLQKDSIEAIKIIVDKRIRDLKDEVTLYRKELQMIRPSGIRHDHRAQEISQKKQDTQTEITHLSQSVNELREHMKNLTRIILNGRSDLVRRTDIFEAS